MTAKPRSFARGAELDAWAAVSNPLAGLTVDGAARMVDAARRGSYARLQAAYREIEAADPILYTVLSRRASALRELDWEVRLRAEGRGRGWDPALAEDQRALLLREYGEAEENGLGRAVVHLATGHFRGFAHALPRFGAGGLTLEGFETLDSWNFCRDPADGAWLWNPGCREGTDGLERVPEGELATVAPGAHVDRPALFIYIRRAVGDRKYGVWLERFGSPHCAVIMPPAATREQSADYLEVARRFARGADTALPAGSQVSFASDARGLPPFADFLRRQQELVVLMATGGTLTTLASPTGIGSGASDSQDAAWRTIVRRDARDVADALNRSVTRRLLDANFPGRPRLAYFDFSDPAPTADEVLETAAKARAAGFDCDPAEVSERTGWRLERGTAPAQPGAWQT